jgi:hypothetical protein
MPDTKNESRHDYDLALALAARLLRPHDLGGGDAKAFLEDASEVLAWIRANKKEND